MPRFLVTHLNFKEFFMAAKIFFEIAKFFVLQFPILDFTFLLARDFIVTFTI